MKKTKAHLEAAALFLMVFVLGVTFGVLASHVWNQRVSGSQAAVNTKPTRDQVMQDLTQSLELTPEQQRQIGTMLDDLRGEWHALDVQREAIRQQFRANVRATLTSQQQVKFDERMKRLDEQRKKEAGRQSGH